MQQLPIEFDCRVEWNGTISNPLDQGSCDGCWSYSTCLALSDRLRINRSSKDLFLKIRDEDGSFILNSLSPTYMINNNLCDTVRGIDNKFCKMGCGGGFIEYGLKYLSMRGTATLKDEMEGEINPKLYKLSKMYKIGGNKGIPAWVLISLDIMNNGPVVAGFNAYDNYDDEKFDKYYNKIEGKELFNHAISIIGWKDYRNKSYWICRNSYGRDYMDNGYFYMLRGVNFCNIENDVWGMQ